MTTHVHKLFAQAGAALLACGSSHYLGGAQVIGPFVSRNLTPENGLPAGHTYAEFKNIMRTGIDYDHVTPLLQVKPWPT